MGMGDASNTTETSGKGEEGKEGGEGREMAVKVSKDRDQEHMG